MKRFYNATESEIRGLISKHKYSIVDVAKGNIKGKGSSKLRCIKNRLKAVSYLTNDASNRDLFEAYITIKSRAGTPYWESLTSTGGKYKGGRYLTKNLIYSALRGIDNGFDPRKPNYSKKKSVEHIIADDVKNSPENPLNAHHQNKNKGILGSVNGYIQKKVLPLVLAAAIGVGVGVYGGYNLKANMQKPARTEQAYVAQTDVKSQEPAKKEATLEQRIVEARAESKEQNKEILGNGGYNYKDTRWTQQKDTPGYSPERLRKKQERDKRFAPITARAKRNLDKTGDGLWRIISSPFKFLYNLGTGKVGNAAKNVVDIPIGALETVSGATGTVNSIGEALIRPPIYAVTGSNMLDRGAENLFDASIGGDSYMDLHADAIQIWNWGKPDGFFDDLGKRPVKSTISIAEDALLIWLLSSVGGDDGGSGVGGGVAGGAPGRGGGPGGP